MTTSVLLLNADYTPIKVLSWEKAICLLLSEKVALVAQYADKLVRSQNLTLPWPSVVALKRYTQVGHKIRFNRANILARDSYACCYCGRRPKTASGRPRLEDLTLDHVVPRARSRDGQVVLPWNGKRVPVTSWENIVTACTLCNSTKADKTPAKAHMKLRGYPKRPNPWDAIRISFGKIQIPSEWMMYVPPDWRGYYTDELDPN